MIAAPGVVVGGAIPMRDTYTYSGNNGDNDTKEDRNMSMTSNNVVEMGPIGIAMAAKAEAEATAKAKAEAAKAEAKAEEKTAKAEEKTMIEQTEERARVARTEAEAFAARAKDEAEKAEALAVKNGLFVNACVEQVAKMTAEAATSARAADDSATRARTKAEAARETADRVGEYATDVAKALGEIRARHEKLQNYDVRSGRVDAGVGIGLVAGAVTGVIVAKKLELDTSTAVTAVAGAGFGGSVLGGLLGRAYDAIRNR